MYSFNYYRPESSGTGSEEKVPIKWMAPESIETNVFDESTDVVSPINSYRCVFCAMCTFCLAQAKADACTYVMHGFSNS